jgi:glycerophosphoryl diester phosphodiesterase
MVRLIAHRGARNLWAENSLEGFRRTAGLPVDAVELDLHLSRDGEVVVIHDPLLDRTTNGAGPVAAHSLEALRQLRLTDTLDQTIPTLSEVLDIFAPTRLHLELEMKTDACGCPYPGLIAKTARLVEERGLTDSVRLTCFVPEVIEAMRADAPRFRRLASLDRRSAEILGGLERAIDRFLALDCTIAIERTLLEVAFDRCHAMIGSERLGVWVPNTPPEIECWLRKPIGQLTSDRPDLAVGIRERLSAPGGLER